MSYLGSFVVLGSLLAGFLGIEGSRLPGVSYLGSLLGFAFLGFQGSRTLPGGGLYFGSPFLEVGASLLGTEGSSRLLSLVCLLEGFILVGFLGGMPRSLGGGSFNMVNVSKCLILLSDNVDLSWVNSFFAGETNRCSSVGIRTRFFTMCLILSMVKCGSTSNSIILFFPPYSSSGIT